MLGNDGKVNVEAQSLKSEKARPKFGEVFLIYAAHDEVLLHTALSLSLHKFSLSGVTRFCKLLTPTAFCSWRGKANSQARKVLQVLLLHSFNRISKYPIDGSHVTR